MDKNEEKKYHAVWHQCTNWALRKGSQSSCSRCKKGHGKPRTQKIQYFPCLTYEEAVTLIDRCAKCGDDIPEDHQYHHCEKCLPEWQERIDKINRAQQYYWRDNV